jgi:hypothetical protein
VESLLSKGGKELKKELEQLIRGENIEKAIEEDIVLKDISNQEDLLWSWLWGVFYSLIFSMIE